MSTPYDPNQRSYGFERGWSYPIVIPDGTVVSYKNFMQDHVNTPDIIQGSNLTFEFCNLSNVAIDTAWTCVSTNTLQIEDWRPVPPPPPED